MAPRNIKVLMIDDRETNLVALESVLGGMGLHLISATSGEEALRRCLEEDFALILLDVQMPGLNGFETAELLRQRERSRQTPIIFVTGASLTEQNVFHGYTAGAVDYIRKPFPAEILRAKVSVFVDLYEKTAALAAQAEALEAANGKLARQLFEIQQLNSDLATANKELEAFSHTAAHDMRAPLRNISAFIGVLMDDYADRLDEHGLEYLRLVDASAQHMSRLIDDVLSLSRVAQCEITVERVDLSDLARTIVRTLKQAEPDRIARVEIRNGLWTKGDPRLLRIALENLLGNAWKYTSHEPETRIEFGLTKRQGKAVYFVRDNGVGFDMADADRLFAPFERLHGSDEFEGTGIGLATVARVVNRHRGQIWSQARPGQGATFWFTLREPDKVLLKLPEVVVTAAAGEERRQRRTSASRRLPGTLVRQEAAGKDRS